jgi:hypothetical protein
VRELRDHASGISVAAWGVSNPNAAAAYDGELCVADTAGFGIDIGKEVHYPLALDGQGREVLGRDLASTEEVIERRRGDLPPTLRPLS